MNLFLKEKFLEATKNSLKRSSSIEFSIGEFMGAVDSKPTSIMTDGSFKKVESWVWKKSGSREAPWSEKELGVRLMTPNVLYFFK